MAIPTMHENHVGAIAEVLDQLRLTLRKRPVGSRVWQRVVNCQNNLRAGVDSSPQNVF
jgi:hypothetical protein